MKNRSAPSGDLKLRVLSALALAPVVLGAVWQGGMYFQILIGLVIILSAWEWARVTCAETWLVDGVLIGGTALLALRLAITPGGMGDLERFFYIAGAIISGMALAGSLASMRGQQLRWRLLGVPYIALGPAALVWLRGQEETGLILTLWLLLLVWAMDSGAYFAGRSIGGPRLAPRISPNKTWAGLIGGMLSAGIAGAFIGWVEPVVTEPLPVLQMAVMSAFIGAWSQAGDIAESWVKRRFGVKDMGNLIPGHGGVLDRIDGLLFAAPAMAAGVLALNSIGT